MIANGVHRAMQYWVDAHAIEHTNKFLTSQNETEQQEPKKKNTANAEEPISTTKDTTSTTTKGWTCYHQIDPKQKKSTKRAKLKILEQSGEQILEN